METRQITILDSATQSKHVINTNATTFGELKQLVKQAGVDINGKDWLEGFTKTSPRGDDSVLPTNITYKGQKTNNLVYMLTNTQKRIRSGASDRQAAYAKVKELNLQDAILKKYGKNFTRCKTEEILAVVNAHEGNSKKGTSAPVNNKKAEQLKAEVNDKNFGKKSIAEDKPELESPVLDATAKAVAQLIIDLKIKDAVIEYINTLTPKDIDLSQAEIDKMFK